MRGDESVRNVRLPPSARSRLKSFPSTPAHAHVRFFTLKSLSLLLKESCASPLLHLHCLFFYSHFFFLALMRFGVPSCLSFWMQHLNRLFILFPFLACRPSALWSKYSNWLTCQSEKKGPLFVFTFIYSLPSSGLRQFSELVTTSVAQMSNFILFGRIGTDFGCLPLARQTGICCLWYCSFFSHQVWLLHTLLFASLRLSLTS